MSKNALQPIFEDYLSDTAERGKLPVSYLKVIDKLMGCRTAALGGHAQYCENQHLCGIWYNSCKHRFCPQCRGMATEEWLLNTQNILLNSPHHHIVFTFPDELNILWRYNEVLMTDMLFKATQQTLLTFSQDAQYLNAKPGIICALHTWGRSLSLHPHIHALVSHGGINGKGEWVVPRKGSLFPQKPLMMVFRGKLLSMIKKAMRQENWLFPPELNEIRLNNVLNKWGRKSWVVHCCERYDHARGVAKYLSRYVKSGPIKLDQVRSCRDGNVRFEYQSHQTQRREVLTLPVGIFVRRLMQHAPLKGKPTIRYCGLYNNAAREKLNKAREALGQVAVSERVILQWQDFLSAKGHEKECPQCGLPVSLLVAVLPVRRSV